MTVQVHIALLDADHRVMVTRASSDAPWSFPSCAVANGDPVLARLVTYLHTAWGVTTLEKTFFPLTFYTDRHHVVHVIYGCRNWVGPHGLQHIASSDNRDTHWARVTRLADQPMDEAATQMLPVLMTVIG